MEPLAGGYRLAGGRIVAEPAPIALVFDLLVRDGSFDDEHEGFQFAAIGLEEPLEEIVCSSRGSAFEIDQRPVDGDFGKSGKRAERDLLDTGLGGGSQRHRITVTTQTCVDPQNMDQRFFCFDCCFR